MALVRRGNCHFYIRSVRRNGRVTSEYVGSGAIALDVARAKADARSRTETRLREWHRETSLWAEFDCVLSLLCDLNRAHARAAMYAAGFYLHHRSWRSRRREMTTPRVPAKVTISDVPEAIRERVVEFLRLSARGDATSKDCVHFFESVRESLTPEVYRFVVERLAQRLNQCDSITPIAPAAKAQQTLVKWLTEGWGQCPRGKPANPADLEVQRRYLDVLRHDLAGPDSPLIERMLADQIVLTCAETHGLSCRVAEAEKQWQYDEATHFDRRRDRATRRMHESIKLLHTLRTNAGPAFQVSLQQNITIPTRETTTSPVIDLLSGRGIESAN